jgi:hypothetical protein
MGVVNYSKSLRHLDGPLNIPAIFSDLLGFQRRFGQLGVAQGLIDSPAVEKCRRRGVQPDRPEKGPQDPDTPEAPETPADEPKPAPVQDPPAEPGRGPYTVRGGDRGTTARVEP